MAWQLSNLPPREVIDIGDYPDDGTGDNLRTAFEKVNNNFSDLYIGLGIENGLDFAELNDTPAEYVPRALLMVNTSANGIVYNTINNQPEITISVVDGTFNIGLNSTITGNRTFSNNLTVQGQANLNGGLAISGTLNLNGGLNATQNSTFGQDLTVNGNLHVAGNTIVKDTYINVDYVSTENILTVSNTKPSTSTTTGAFTVAGGAGVAGKLYVGDSVNTPTVLTTDLTVYGTETVYRSVTNTGYFWANGAPYLNQSSFNTFFDTQLATKTTDNLTEGSNLYYTNARARNAISASGSLSYNSSTGVISYTTPSTSGVAEGSNLYYTDSRARAAISVSGSLSYNSGTGVISYNTPSTSGIAEGSNLYYTDARARSAISINATGLTYDSSTGIVGVDQNTIATKSYVSSALSTATSSTDSITEGSNNLYFTVARARAAISATGSLSYNSSTGVISYTTPSTSGITEGSNLYYTDARARAAISATGSLSYDNSTGVISFTMPALSTSTVTEGTNLYYTNARARAAISVTGAGSYDSSTGVITVTGGVTSVNGQTGAVTLGLADISGTADSDLNMGTYKITNLANPVAGTDAANKSYVDSTVSAFASASAGGALTLPPTFFKAFEVAKDNAVDQGAGTTTIIGNTRFYSFNFSTSGTTRAKRAFYPYITTNAAYSQANSLVTFQYASKLPGKTTPFYTNGGSAFFYTNGSTAPIYTDTTIEWTDVGTDVFALPFTTGVNSIRVTIFGDGVHPTTFSDFVLKAFMPATTEYSTQLIGGLSSKSIVFNNTFEEVKHITMTLNYQGYAWVTNMTNVGATLNFSSADANGIVYAAISGY